MKSLQGDNPDRSFLASLEQERHAIFSTDASIAEKEARWLQRKAEITAYLVNDDVASSHSNVMKSCPPLARNISNASEGRKRAYQLPDELQHVENISPKSLALTRPSTVTQTYHFRRPKTQKAHLDGAWTSSGGRSNSFHAVGQVDFRNDAIAPQQSQEDDHVLDPQEFIASKKYASNITQKRQRLDGTYTAAMLSTPPSPMTDQLASSNLFSMPMPSSLQSGLHAPSYSLSSRSTDSSSFCGGEDMTRQGSSASSMSMTEGFGMMRFNSNRSADLDTSFFLPFGGHQDGPSFLSQSMTSGVTEKPASRCQSTTASDDPLLRQNDALKNMGSGFDPDDFLSDPIDFPSSVDFTGNGMPWQKMSPSSYTTNTANMQRTDSQNSAASTSSISFTDAQQRAAMRLSKQVANGATQTILPKVSPSSSSKPAPKPIAGQKCAISRVSHSIKTKEPLQCPDCSTELRGQHELQRHWDNVHARIKSVWICVQPESSPIMPKRPLNICKQCKDQKLYNADYNAAAHLKRGHFHPSKRGRRPRGNAQVQRASTLEKNSDPRIDVLKEHGWLKEVFITNDGLGTVADKNEVVNDANDDEHQQNEDSTASPAANRYGEFSQDSQSFPRNSSTHAIPTPPVDSQQIAFCTQALGLHAASFPNSDEDFSLVETSNNDWPIAVPMEHSFSAPGRIVDKQTWASSGMC